MDISEKTIAPPAERRCCRLEACLWLASIFLLGLGARLWLIHRFGTPLPFWDQWEETRYLFEPYFQGKLTWALLFKAHNEHRIFFTRLYDLGLLLLNGQWDNRLQMVCNAIIYVTGMTVVAGAFMRLLGRKAWPLVALAFITVLVLPFAWENTLAGFHSQVYFVILSSLGTIWFLGFHRAPSLPWILGVCFAFGSLLTMGAGLIGSAAVVGLICFRTLPDWFHKEGVVSQPQGIKKQIRLLLREWPTLLVCLSVVIFGLVTTVKVPYHESLKAHSPFVFLISLGRYLSWPWVVVPIYGPVNILPEIALAVLYVFKPEARTQSVEFILGLGLWNVLQALASAYARGSQAFPQWRYMDAICFITIVNVFSIPLVIRLLARTPRWQSCARIFAFLWSAGAVAGLLLLSWRAFSVDIAVRASEHRLQLLTFKSYLATGDRYYLETKQKEFLARFAAPDEPQDHPQALINMLSLPHIRALLPAEARDPITSKVVTQGAFETNRIDQLPLTPPGTPVWMCPPATTRGDSSITLTVFPTNSSLPFLHLEAAAGPGGLMKAVVRSKIAGHHSTTRTLFSRETWTGNEIKMPAGDFELEISAAGANSWVAFQAPTVMGRLSHWAACLTRRNAAFLVCGLICVFATTACRVRRISSPKAV